MELSNQANQYGSTYFLIITYAKQIADRKNPEFIDARFKLKDEKLRRMRLTEQYNNILEDIDARNKTRKRNQTLLDDLLEDRSLQVDTYGEESDDVKEIDRQISRLQKALGRLDASEPEFVHQKAKLERDLADSEKALDELNAKVNELGESIHHHLYTVEIPDDNGSNYLDWDKKYSTDEVYGIVDRIINSAINSENLKDYDNGEILRDAADRLAEKCDEYEQKGEVLTGEILYYIVHDNPKTASEILISAGFTGMRYPADYRRGGRADGAKNYVIFNEKDAQITDHVRFFRGKDGEAYGFTVDGKIYLDPKKVNAETPIHEYAHLWSTALQQKDAKAWGDVVELMKGTGVWDEVRENYPELETDDEIADEVLATYSGRNGAERLREEMRKVSESDGSLTEKAAAISALERVRNAISRFWRKVAEMLGFRYTKAEDVADHVLSDLLEGRNPNVGVDTDGKAREMGSKVNNRMAELRTYFENTEMNEIQSKVADVFSGASPKTSFTFRDAKGKVRDVEFKSGNEFRAGIKHAIFRHYGTTESPFTKEDVLEIPYILENGNRHEHGSEVNYTATINGIGYTVGFKKGNGKENFTTFYTNRDAIQVNNRLSNTQLSAQTDPSASRDAKVGNNSETRQESAEENSVKESKRSPSSSELALRDGLVDVLRESGLGVSLDGKEGQRVLDWANGMAREMRTYHGTHADFDHFDHSFMNSGEGAQAYGWGTYLTEVEGIGRTYAKQITESHEDAPSEYSWNRLILEDKINDAKHLEESIGNYKDAKKKWEEFLDDTEDDPEHKARLERKKEVVKGILKTISKI